MAGFVPVTVAGPSVPERTHKRIGLGILFAQVCRRIPMADFAYELCHTNLRVNADELARIT